jgi:hypothetical protein
MKFREVFSSWHTKNPVLKERPDSFKSNAKLPWNIYGDKIQRDHVGAFHRVHFVWKYKFLVPLILLSKKVLGKYLVKKVSDEPHNRNIHIFDKAFERSLTDWNVYYRRMGGPDDKRRSPEYWRKQSQKAPCTTLRTMKEFTITMVYKDTAYREFFNILMHNIAHDMVREYGNKKKYPKGVGHLFYADGGPYDVHYAVLFKWMEMQGKVQFRDVHEYLAQYEKEKLEKKRRWPKTTAETAPAT